MTKQSRHLYHLYIDCRGRLRLPRNDIVLVIARNFPLIIARNFPPVIARNFPPVIARNAVTKQSRHLYHLYIDCRGRLRLPRNDIVLVIARNFPPVIARNFPPVIARNFPPVIARNAVTKQSRHLYHLYIDCRGRLRLPRNDIVLVIARNFPLIIARNFPPVIARNFPPVIARNAVTKQSRHLYHLYIDCRGRLTAPSQ